MFFSLLTVPSLEAQRFQRMFVGPGNDIGNCCIHTLDGGYLVAGTKMSASGYTDICLIRYDSLGTMLWYRTYGRSNDDAISSVIANSDGSFTCLGHTDNDARTERHLLILRIAANGNLISYKIFRLTESKKLFLLHRLVRLSDGNLFITFTVSSYPYSAGASDAGYIKIQDNGTILYAKSSNFAQTDHVFGATELPGGSVVISGHSMRDIGVHKLFIAKIDGTGNATVKFFPLVNNYHAGDIAYIPQTQQLLVQANAQKTYMTGHWKAFMSIADTNLNILKINYYNTNNESKNLLFSRIQLIDTSNMYVSGTYNDDIFLARVNTNLTIPWMKCFGAPLHSTIITENGLCVSNPNDIAFTGYTTYSTFSGIPDYNIVTIRTDTSYQAECFAIATPSLMYENIETQIFNESLTFVNLGIETISTSFNVSSIYAFNIDICCYTPYLQEGILDTVCITDEPTFFVPYRSSGPVNKGITAMRITLSFDSTFIQPTGIAIDGPVANRNGSATSVSVATDISIAGRVTVYISDSIDANYEFLSDTTDIVQIQCKLKKNYFSHAPIVFSTHKVVDYYQGTEVERCGLSDTARFFANASFLSSSTTDVTCHNGNNGQISINTTSIPPVMYQWSNGASTQNISGLNAAAYIVTVTAGGSCINTGSFVISQPPDYAISGSTTNVSAAGASDGSIVLSVTGSNGEPYQYSWNNGKTTANISSLPVGHYTVTIRDSKNCQATADFSIYGSITTSASITHVSCYGYADGCIILNTHYGTPPFIYQWNTGHTGDSVCNLPAGKYIVSTTDSMLNKSIDTFTINTPEELYLYVVSQHDARCIPETLGSVTVSTGGGTSPYIYSWSNGDTSATADSLPSGVHFVSVTDINGCETFLPVPIQLIPPSTGISAAPVICDDSDYNLFDAITGYDSGGSWYELPAETIISNGVIPQGSLRYGSSQYTYRIHMAAPCGNTETTVNLTVMPALSAGTGSELYVCSETIDLSSLLHNADPGGSWINIKTNLSVAQQLSLSGANRFFLAYKHSSQYGCPESVSYSTIYTDSIAPAIQCPEDRTIKIPSLTKEYVVEGSELDPVYTSDNCNYILTNTINAGESLRGIHITEDMQIGWFASDEKGNISSCSFMLRIEPFIPNIFTPNGDGYNDTWDFSLGNKYNHAIVNVYNRWGQLIYSSQPGYPKKWTGESIDGKAADGAYSYQIISNNKILYKGTVTIIR